jgi:hypothetical protein
MSLASWLAAQSRRIKSAFQTLTGAGRSEKRAAKLIRLVERAGAEEFKAVPGSKGARYFLPGAPKTAPTISRAQLVTKKYGAHPTKLAAERKAGVRPYASAASEAQAAKQIATKAEPARKKARRAKAKRFARRSAASTKAGIAKGSDQRRKTLKYIDKMYAQHERYLKTGREKISTDEYRDIIHLMYEYFGDDERMERMQESWSVFTQEAA